MFVLLIFKEIQTYRLILSRVWEKISLFECKNAHFLPLVIPGPSPLWKFREDLNYKLRKYYLWNRFNWFHPWHNNHFMDGPWRINVHRFLSLFFSSISNFSKWKFRFEDMSPFYVNVSDLSGGKENNFFPISRMTWAWIVGIPLKIEFGKNSTTHSMQRVILLPFCVILIIEIFTNARVL